MKLIYTILCTDILTDQESGATSYIKAIDKIASARIPVLIPSLRIGTYWDFTEEVGKNIYHRLRAVNPLGKEAFIAPEQPMKVINERHRYNIHIAGFNVDVEGEYKFFIEAKTKKNGKWQTMNEIVLPVELDASLEPIQIKSSKGQ